MSVRKVPIALTVNGQPCEGLAEPRKLLCDFLREDLGINGVRVTCEQGVCGACTIEMDGHTVRSCLVLAVQAQGAAITTIEGLAPDGQLHPIQQAFWDNHALQCGFCTPGMVMQVRELLRDNPSPSESEIREGISGNICRCTGYVHIVRAVQAAAKTLAADPKGGGTR